MNISLREEIDTKLFSFYLTQADKAYRLSKRRNLSSYEFFDKTNIKLGLDSAISKACHPFLWSSQSVKPYDIQIGTYYFKWNSINGHWINSANALNEIGCINTVQGYDLNYFEVIIGPELIYKNGQYVFI